MKISKTFIEDLLIIEPQLFKDGRGFFYESYNKNNLDKVINVDFVQDNESKSNKGVIRGLHFQLPPFEQTKLVRCVSGEILDIAVDLMGYTSNSRTYIFSNRVAPIQVNYLGYPGTMGSKIYDYILGDEILIPKESREYYSEKIVYLPNSYQPNDLKKKNSENSESRNCLWPLEKA